MNISREIKLVTPRVRDHRGYTDMIFDMTVFIDFTDLDTESTIGYQIVHSFDTEIEYDEENPFVPFSDITEETVNTLIERLIENEKIGGQVPLNEWIIQRFENLYSEPKSKPFSFQEIPQNPVGVGSTPVS